MRGTDGNNTVLPRMVGNTRTRTAQHRRSGSYWQVNCRRKVRDKDVGHDEVGRRTHVDDIIEPPVLCDGYDGRHVVGVGVDGGKAVVARWETGGDIRGELSVDGAAVYTLEERKGGGVKDGRVRKVAHLLNDEATEKSR